MYIKQKADGIRYDADLKIYDKGVDRLNPFSGPEPEWLNNELGDKFAKLFFTECGKMLPNVVMYEYYSYLSSLYRYAGSKTEESRVSSAEYDLRNNYFTKKDWQNLIAVTHNITAKTECSKMMKAVCKVTKN